MAKNDDAKAPVLDLIGGTKKKKAAATAVKEDTQEEYDPRMEKITTILAIIAAVIIGAIVTGFIAFGESFIIHIWNKPDFAESYLCAILLIIPK